MRPVVLIRKSLAEEYEIEAAKRHFKVIHLPVEIEKGDLVIPRYSALPFYKELEDSAKFVGARLVNTFSDHRYIADLKNWYEDLKEFTPETWFRTYDIPDKGPFVLKGETNSKKQQWKTSMFAQSKREAFEIERKLMNDVYIGQQQIYARRYVELNSFGESVVGMPISEEYRFFFYRNKLLSSGFYWSEHVDYIKEEFGFIPNPNQVPKEFLDEIALIVSENIDFFVVDVAKTKSGKWVAIELNDGSQSGLSENDPNILYKNLKEVILQDISSGDENK